MTRDANILPMDEFRAIWVYGMNLSAEDWGALLAETDDPETGTVKRPLRDALGLTSLDSDFIDFLVTDELEAVSLSKLLVEAHGMDAQSVEPDAALLDRLRGQVLLVHSGALNGKSPSVEPKPPLKFIGRYSEALESDATLMAPAHGVASTPPPADVPAPPTKKKPSDAAVGGRVATVALLIMFLLVIVMIWIAS